MLLAFQLSLPDASLLFLLDHGAGALPDLCVWMLSRSPHVEVIFPTLAFVF